MPVFLLKYPVTLVKLDIFRSRFHTLKCQQKPVIFAVLHDGCLPLALSVLHRSRTELGVLALVVRVLFVHSIRSAMASNVADERCRERSRGQPGEGVDAVVDVSNNIIAGEQSTSSTSETSKRGRGRPRKNCNNDSSAPPSSGGAAVVTRRTTRGRKGSMSSEVENPALDPADGSTLLRTCQNENLPEPLHCKNCQASNQMHIGFRMTSGTGSRACMQLWESQNCKSQSDRLQHQLISQFLQRDAAAALEASAAAPPSSPKKKSTMPLSPSKKGTM